MTPDYYRVVGAASRAYEFEMRSVGRGGRRLVGTVAMFHKRTRIPDRNGDFEENLHPGFAKRSLQQLGFPIMQFDHGKDPRTGTVPIGRYEVFQETRTGYDVEGDLFDNELVEPIRQAIEHRAIKGMSFRFSVTKNGDKWERRAGRDGIDLRHVMDADVPEAGPVVFPAYRDTTVAVRSLLAAFSAEEQQELLDELRAMAGLSTDLTGQTSRSTGRGEHDIEPREGDMSPNARARQRALLLRRNPIVLP
jgi:phage head maturation protease